MLLKENWLASAVIVTLQAMFLLILGPDFVVFVVAGVSALAFSVAIGSAILQSLLKRFKGRQTNDPAIVALMTASVASFLVAVGIHFAATSMFFVFVVALIAFATVAAVVSEERKEEGNRYPGWALFAALMPLGVGMVVGGALLLYYRRKEKVAAS